MSWIFELLGVSLAVPDHRTLSRRAVNLKSPPEGCPLPEGPVHQLIDSTGLNIYGAGEWSREKHSAKDVTIVRKRAFEFHTNLERRV